MALQATQLTNAITASQTSFMLTTVPSSIPAVGAQPLPVGVPALIDSEFMFIVAQPATGIVQVRGRGSDGTAATAHDTLANVYVSSNPGDFTAPQAGTFTTLDPAEDGPISLGQDATVTLSGATAVYNINKATAAAIIVVAPSLENQGVTYTFTSNTAAAHVLTATALIKDGTSTVKTYATFAAYAGASITFVSENGFLNVFGSPQNVTLS